MSENYIRNVLEAALLAAGRPLQLGELGQLFDENARPEQGELRAAIDALAADYGSRGIEVKETANGFRIQVKRELANEVSRLWPERPPRYSRALLETLALIAYRQPITRAEIEAVRGVAVNPNIIKTVIERNWVRVVGTRDVPGRPELLGTTKEFLDYFGLRSLEELPPLAELKAMGEINLQLDLAKAGEGSGSEGGGEGSGGTGSGGEGSGGEGSGGAGPGAEGSSGTSGADGSGSSGGAGSAVAAAGVVGAGAAAVALLNGDSEEAAANDQAAAYDGPAATSDVAAGSDAVAANEAAAANDGAAGHDAATADSSAASTAAAASDAAMDIAAASDAEATTAQLASASTASAERTNDDDLATVAAEPASLEIVAVEADIEIAPLEVEPPSIEAPRFRAEDEADSGDVTVEVETLSLVEPLMSFETDEPAPQVDTAIETGEFELSELGMSAKPSVEVIEAEFDADDLDNAASDDDSADDEEELSAGPQSSTELVASPRDRDD